jgi:hypothetical protein
MCHYLYICLINISIKILSEFEPELTKPAQSVPLDLYVRRYMKENKNSDIMTEQ